MSLSSFEINSNAEAAEILAHCVNLLDAYDATTTPVDYHFEQYCGFAEVILLFFFMWKNCISFIRDVIVGNWLIFHMPKYQYFNSFKFYFYKQTAENEKVFVVFLVFKRIASTVNGYYI